MAFRDPFTQRQPEQEFRDPFVGSQTSQRQPEQGFKDPFQTRAPERPVAGPLPDYLLAPAVQPDRPTEGFSEAFARGWSEGENVPTLVGDFIWNMMGKEQQNIIRRLYPSSALNAMDPSANPPLALQESIRQELKARNLDPEKNPHLVGEFLGHSAKALADPSLLYIQTRSFGFLRKAYDLMFRGAQWGLGYEGLRHLRDLTQDDKEEFNDKRAAQTIAITSLGGPALYTLFKGFGTTFQHLGKIRAEKKAEQLLERTLQNIKDGYNPQRAAQVASEDLGILKEGRPATNRVQQKIVEAEKAAEKEFYYKTQRDAMNKYAEIHGATPEERLQNAGAKITPQETTVPPRPPKTPRPKYVGVLKKDEAYDTIRSRERGTLIQEQGLKKRGWYQPEPHGVDDAVLREQLAARRPFGAVDKPLHQKTEISKPVRQRNLIRAWNKASRNAAGVRQKYVGDVGGEAPKLPEGPINPKKMARYDNSLKQKIKDYIYENGVYPFTNRIANVLYSIADRIEPIAPSIAHALRRFEMESSIATHEGLVKVNDFKNEFWKLSKQEQTDFDRMLKNEDIEGIAEFTRSRPALKASWEATRQYLNEARLRLNEVGYNIPENQMYFPRVVRDYRSLTKNLTGEEYQPIRRALDEAEAKKGASLTQVEASEAIDKVLRTKYNSGQVGHTAHIKDRKLLNVPDEILADYELAPYAIHQYVRQVEHNIAKRKLFGHFNVDPNKHGGDYRSLGEVVNAAMRNGDMSSVSARDQELILDLLTARFGAGEQGVGPVTHKAKNLFYMLTLGNPESAMTQVGDLGPTAYLHGFRNTMLGMADVINPSSDAIGAVDYGLAMPAAEMADTRGIARLLSGVLEGSGFLLMDRFGKNVHINAARNRYRRLAKTEKGRLQIKQKYGSAFRPEEFDQVIVDLAANRINPNTKFIWWTELSGAQPISLSELPAFYLRNPNLRFMYALQTFTTRQLGLFYKTAIREMGQGIKTGDMQRTALGAANAGRYIMTMAMANYAADEMKKMLRMAPQEDKPFSEQVTNLLWRNFGAAEYVTNKLAQGDRASASIAAVAIFGGPYGGLMNMGYDIGNTLVSDDYNWTRATRHLPVVGRPFYMWFGGGLEEEERLNEMRKEREEQQKWREYLED